MSLPEGDGPGDVDTTEATTEAHHYGAIQHHTPMGYMRPGVELSFANQLALLGFHPGGDLEHVGLLWSRFGKQMCSEVAVVQEATRLVECLRISNHGRVDQWFGVNPVLGPPRLFQRGKARDVTRLACLWADLDVKEGGCPDISTALDIIDDLADRLGERPTMITHTGNGLHPIWSVDTSCGSALVTMGRSGRPDNRQAAALVKRWGRLVTMVAAQHNCHADPVYDLNRVLRVAGSVNNKFADAPVSVRCLRDRGRPVGVDQLRQCLDGAGIGGDSPRRKRVVPAGVTTVGGLAALLDRRAGRALVSAVAKANDGSRNNVLFWAACRAIEEGLLVDYDTPIWDELADAAAEAGLPDDEIAATLRSALFISGELEVQP